jgi:hypothetical protein
MNDALQLKETRQKVDIDMMMDRIQSPTFFITGKVIIIIIIILHLSFKENNYVYTPFFPAQITQLIEPRSNLAMPSVFSGGAGSLI